MIYNFREFVTKIDENIASSEFMNRFGLTEDDSAVAADAPKVEEEPAKEEGAEGGEDKNEELEKFKKEHLDVMFSELGSEDFDKFYSSEFKAWKDMEDGEEKDKKKEEILNKIKDMFKLGEEKEEKEEENKEGSTEESKPEEASATPTTPAPASTPAPAV